MASTSKFLVIYHAVSAGQNGPNLGCDEEDIVMIVYLVLDVSQNKVRTLTRLKGEDDVRIVTRGDVRLRVLLFTCRGVIVKFPQ